MLPEMIMQYKSHYVADLVCGVPMEITNLRNGRVVTIEPGFEHYAIEMLDNGLYKQEVRAKAVESLFTAFSLIDLKQSDKVLVKQT